MKRMEIYIQSKGSVGDRSQGKIPLAAELKALGTFLSALASDPTSIETDIGNIHLDISVVPDPIPACTECGANDVELVKREYATDRRGYVGVCTKCNAERWIAPG